MDINCLNKLCVAGSGTMGRQIALCAAIHGIDTYLYDVSAAALENADSWVNEYLAGRVAKGRMTQEQTDAARAKMHIEPSLEAAVKDAQLVIEAIIERQDIKESFFREVSELVAEDTVLATNSSYLVSSLFRDAVKNPGRLANLHFFHPVQRYSFVVEAVYIAAEEVHDLHIGNAFQQLRIVVGLSGTLENRVIFADIGTIAALCQFHEGAFNDLTVVDNRKRLGTGQKLRLAQHIGHQRHCAVSGIHTGSRFDSQVSGVRAHSHHGLWTEGGRNTSQTVQRGNHLLNVPFICFGMDAAQTFFGAFRGELKRVQTAADIDKVDLFGD